MNSLTFEQAIRNMKAGKVCVISGADIKYRIVKVSTSWGNDNWNDYEIQENYGTGWRAFVGNVNTLLSSEWFVGEEEDVS